MHPVHSLVRHKSRVIDLQKEQQQNVPHKKSGLEQLDYLRLKDHYDTPHYPIVLCHGFSGFDTISIPTNWLPKHKAKRAITRIFQLDYWCGIRESLETLGSTVLIGRVPPFGTIEERAKMLDKFIDRECQELRKKESKSTIHKNHSHEDETFKLTHKPIKVNLISHSMGGLDSRYLISRFQDNKNYKVVSLTTISTPHHGSECADFLVGLVAKNSYLKKLCPQSVYELTTTNMEEFNAKVPDNPDVQYFSYGAKFNPKWFNVFNLTWRIMRRQISKREAKSLHNASGKKIDKSPLRLANDGMVSVESSQWGKYLGTLDEVDHLDLINWTNKTRTAIDKLVFNEEPKFNALALYLHIADTLAKKGL
ncbi:alpha/beta-hydrolase [Suhomyces tanzawaensis NRRL Y-17324]|uniref:Alpha/beta-hydrolase n=1 Tax=Suhomyces tanzawaensis NRRL Y-17324 TaxID=984487 RepID=A0A1E4SLE5_9ASCO|nr:alpha/beta-hydrolase [Suhomyces tanzawaensis NRRL Y-17324]ODV80329.1 alpha/beta-hydrolase [Suhomyces tanzawaensis NRRL Y-17324]